MRVASRLFFHSRIYFHFFWRMCCHSARIIFYRQDKVCDSVPESGSTTFYRLYLQFQKFGSDWLQLRLWHWPRIYCYTYIYTYIYWVAYLESRQVWTTPIGRTLSPEGRLAERAHRSRGRFLVDLFWEHVRWMFWLTFLRTNYTPSPNNDANNPS